MKRLLQFLILAFPLCAFAQYRVNVMTTNTSAGVTNKVLEIALPYISGAATNGIQMLNGFGTNTTLYSPRLGYPTITNPVFIIEDVGVLYSYVDNIWYAVTGDGAGLPSVSFDARTLHDTIGDAVLNWQDGTLIGNWRLTSGVLSGNGSGLSNVVGTLATLAPWFYTNTAAASSISNNLSLKTAGLAVGAGNLTWDSLNSIAGPDGVAMAGNNDVFRMYGTPHGLLSSNQYGSFRVGMSNSPGVYVSPATYFSNSIYLGGTNGIIGIGSNLVVQGGILSGTATGGGGGTNSYWEEDSASLWGEPTLSLTNYVVLLKGVNNQFRLLFGNATDAENLTGFTSTDGEVYVVHSNSASGLRTTWTWNDNNWTRHVSALPLAVQGDFSVESGDATFYQDVTVEGDLSVNGTMGLATAYVTNLTAENLVSGSVTLDGQTNVVATSSVGATSRIFLTYHSLDGDLANIAEFQTDRTNGVSFTVLSSKAADTNVVTWLIMNP